MDLAAANQLLCDELYDAALVAYGSAIDGDDKCAAAYAGRAAIYLRLEKYTNALQDANAALAEDGSCEPALYRKGLACFHLDEFETALDSFRKGLKLLGADAAAVRHSGSACFRSGTGRRGAAATGAGAGSVANVASSLSCWSPTSKTWVRRPSAGGAVVSARVDMGRADGGPYSVCGECNCYQSSY